MWFNVLTNVLAALVAVDATPLRRRTLNHVVHEERRITQGHWAKSHPVYKSAILPVRIGLAQQNLHRAEEFMNEVSHPESPNYGKHWSPEKIIETFRPKQESVDMVMEWLEMEGIYADRVRASASRSWLTFNATVEEVEYLLKTQYHVFKHTSSEHRHVACDKYHIPDHLLDHIDIVTPTVHFDQQIGHDRNTNHKSLSEDAVVELKKRAVELQKRQRPEHAIVGTPDDGFLAKQGAVVENALMDLNNCDSMITPACLRALYATPPGSLSSSNNTLGIVEYTPQAFLQSDLNMYFKQFEPRLDGTSPIVTLIDNAVVQTTNKSFNFNGESALDLEFAMALISPQQATLYQVGDIMQGGSFNNFLDGIDGSYCTFEGGDSKDPNIDGQYSPQVACGTTSPTNVISTSYGFNEADLGAKYEQRQCAEYMKLGLRGVSVIYSSGDSGVGGNRAQCIDSQTGAYNDGSAGIFNPSFPGGCPWVTSVGATQILNGSTVRTPESACEEVIFSGGGFSNVFAMPGYQQKAVAEYYSSHAPPYGADRYNNSRVVRGFPDVSANGARYVTAVDGRFSLSFGTSASAPVFASILTLINEKRIQAGKGPVGFVNPALYANPTVLNDVTNGNNPGCGTKGFSAVQGWDPLTGLGTPNYPQMEAMFLSLP